MGKHRKIKPRPLKKKKTRFSFMRYDRLSAEIQRFGYAYTWKKEGAAVLLMLAGIGLIGILFKLHPIGIVVVAFGAMCYLPGIIKNSYENLYEQHRFSDSNIYIEQMLYSFRKEQKILIALQDVSTLFKEGKIKQCILEAIDGIQYNARDEYPEQKALLKIEEAYACDRLIAVHRFMQKVEQIGGKFEDSIEILLHDRSMWMERTMELQKERARCKRNVCISIALSLLICLSTLYLMPKDIDISNLKITGISTTVLLLASIHIFYRADRKLTINWLQQTTGKKEEKLAEKYYRMAAYDESVERKKSMLYALIPLALMFYGLWVKRIYIIVIGMVGILLTLQQHKIGYTLNRRLVIREVEKAFPQWLMEMALLLQGDNVQVSLRKTYDSAPTILRPELEWMLESLMDHPESAEPYLDFMKDLELPEIQSTMKMLYSISSGHGGDMGEQIKEIIHRNNLLMDKAEKLMNEDRLAGINLYFLLPMLLGAFKLILDLSTFMVAFLTSVHV